MCMTKHLHRTPPAWDVKKKLSCILTGGPSAPGIPGSPDFPRGPWKQQRKLDIYWIFRVTFQTAKLQTPQCPAWGVVSKENALKCQYVAYHPTPSQCEFVAVCGTQCNKELCKLSWSDQQFKGLYRQALGLCQWQQYEILLRCFRDHSEFINRCVDLQLASFWPAFDLFQVGLHFFWHIWDLSDTNKRLSQACKGVGFLILPFNLCVNVINLL